MFFKKLLILFISIFGNSLVAQIENTETIDAEGIQEIIILADEIFQVEINTASKNSVEIKSISEGEYLQHIHVQSKIAGEKLVLTSAYQEILTSGFDKLSAHKVYAVNLQLSIPENLKVTVISNLASVYAQGSFRYFEVELKSGRCELINFQGEALINTYGGDVWVETNRANVDAQTNHGKIQVDKSLKSGEPIHIKSISGDIKVMKTQ